MVTVTLLALANIVWRIADYHSEPVTLAGIAALSGVLAVLLVVGATFGGSLVFDYGFNVETAGDHPVWHRSEVDVFSGHHDPAPTPEPSPGPALPPDHAATPR